MHKPKKRVFRGIKSIIFQGEDPNGDYHSSEEDMFHEATILLKNGGKIKVGGCVHCGMLNIYELKYEVK